MSREPVITAAIIAAAAIAVLQAFLAGGIDNVWDVLSIAAPILLGIGARSKVTPTRVR